MVDVPDQHTFEIYTDRLKESIEALSKEISWLKQENSDLRQRLEALEEIAGIDNEHAGV